MNRLRAFVAPVVDAPARDECMGSIEQNMSRVARCPPVEVNTERTWFSAVPIMLEST